ncbi:MAG: MGDG synthase family glycosyltransferase [Acidobacteriota bacterium]
MHPRLVFLTATTGGGHDSAAAAVAEAVRLVSPRPVEVRIVHPIEQTHAINRLFCSVYNWLLCRHQHWMRYYFFLVNTLRPNERRLNYLLWKPSGRRLIEDERPDAVVSFHPMTNHFCAWLLEDQTAVSGRSIPMAVVVTDPVPPFWRGWACDSVQRYYVPTEHARAGLVDLGIDERRIHTMGMPVHPNFLRTGSSRPALRQSHGLDPGRFTILINAGAIGSLQYLDVLGRLLDVALPVQILFLCGDNAELQTAAAELAAQSRTPTRILGPTQRIDELMQLSDVMITKPGGLTTFEAFAKGLPILVWAAGGLMPQEAGMGEFIEREGCGIILHDLGDLQPALLRLLDNPDVLDEMRRRSVSLSRPESALEIARDLLEQLLPLAVIELQPQSRTLRRGA